MIQRYEDMDDDERIEFLKRAYRIVDLLDNIGAEDSIKPALVAVWALAGTRDSVVNFATHFEIDRESCIDEAERHGVWFLRNLVQVTVTLSGSELPAGVPRNIAEMTDQKAKAIAARILTPGYRKTIAHVLESFFRDQREQGEL